MKVSQSQILQRGLKCRCPNCGGKTLFESGLNMQKECPECGLTFERGEGFFLGSMSINYGVTLTVWLAPVAILWGLEILPGFLATILAVIGAVGFPILFYRHSRSIWLAIYYYFLPHELPKNRTDAIPVDD